MWKRYRLSELTNIVGGGTPKTSISEYWNGDIPWLSVVDFVGERKYVYDTEKSITNMGLENSSTKILKKGQIILSARGTVGEIAVLGKDMAFNQSCYGLDAKSPTTNEFLYYLIKANINQLKANSSGAVFDTIIRETFDHITVELPPLEVQKRIVEILSALDDKIELNRQTNATLEAIAQAIFKEWFIDFNFPGATGEMVDSPLGPIPKGWKLGKLGDFVSITSGKGIQKNKLGRKGYPVLGANGIIGESDEYLLNKEAILTGRVGTLGTFQLVNEKAWVTDNVLILQPLNHKNFHYTYHWVQQIDFQNLNRGSTQPLITKRDLLDQALLVPERVVIEGFDTTCRIFYSLINENEKQSISLQNIRNNLLPKLMEGEF